MNRWLLVTKESDYNSENSNWIDLDKKEELYYHVNRKMDPGDKVLIYRSGQWTAISHILEVKTYINLGKGNYKIWLHKKISLPQYLELAELKEKGIFKKKRKFRRRVYKIPLENWSEIIGFLIKKNPKLLSPPDPITFLGPNESGYPVNLKKNFIEHLRLVEEFNLELFSEESTKYRIILPLLKYMGWNIHDTQKLYPEDFVSDRFVDYILTDCKGNQICLEAKKPAVMELDDNPENQLKDYCASKNIPLGILTNGITWRFYKFSFYDKDLGAIKKVYMQEMNLLNEDKDLIFNKFLEFFWNNKTSPHKLNLKNTKPSDILKMAGKLEDLNESEVKQVIVIPLLQSLGWDIYNDKEFIFSPKTQIKVQKKYKKIKKNNFVDFVLKGKIVAALEIKRMGIKDLEIHAGDVKSFCEKKKYGLGITTDGKKWNFIFFKNGRYENDETLELDNLSKKDLKFFNYIKK